MKKTFMVASTGSGRGKTTFVTGLLSVLKDSCDLNTEKMSVHAFKCGPDYIDPMFHKEVLSIPSTNLDPFFCDNEKLKYVFEKNSGDINVIEAAMGLYDGIGTSSKGSAYDVAKALECSIVLLIDGQGMGYSIVPVIKGFLAEDKYKLIKGIVINRISENYYSKISKVIERETSVKVFGYVPKIKGAELQSRYLGLLSPKETDFRNKLALVSSQIKESVDIDALLEVATQKEDFYSNKKGIDNKLKDCLKGKKIAIAKDEAFSFFYEENIDLLKYLGAEITFFSPIHDENINGVKDKADALIFYGGYPENYAKQLSQNKTMLQSIKAAYESGVRIIAECGGFMYLLEQLEASGEVYDMVGLIKGSSYRTKGLVRFGYVNVESDNGTMKAHEFHHYDTRNVEYSEEYTVRNEASSECYKGIIKTDRLLAGFPHMYYLSCANMICDFLCD